jgi:hypothetical protein
VLTAAGPSGKPIPGLQLPEKYATDRAKFHAKYCANWLLMPKLEKVKLG